MEIQLTCRRKDFEEIYYEGKRGNIFFSSELKTDFLIFFVIALFWAVCLTIYSSLPEDKSFSWLYPLSFLGLASLISFWVWFVKARDEIVWKASMKSYLDKLEKKRLIKLIFSDLGFSLYMDEEEYFEKWDSIFRLDIGKDFIGIQGSTSFTFPRNSMSPENYQQLENFIRSRVMEHDKEVSSDVTNES
jgi:hypothetical protein